MRALPIYGIGFFFILIGAGLFAVSLRRRKPPATKAEQREEAALRAEANKLRLAAGVLAGIGLVFILIS